METKWWQKSVVYQIYPRSFCDSNNDGIGDINGIRSKLGYLEKLGIEVIWLSPVYCSPNDDNGYDISDYYDISPEFGTLDEMKALLKEKPASGFFCFTEDRMHDIRLENAIPARWVGRDIQSRNSFRGKTQPGEYYTWQIGIFAPFHAVEEIQIECSDLKNERGDKIKAASLECLNLGGTDKTGKKFRKQVDVEKGNVQALWMGTDIPSSAQGTYTGKVYVKDRAGNTETIDVALIVEGNVLADHGDNEGWRKTRLRWLNSTIGEADTPTAPYTALRQKESVLTWLGGDVELAATGLPSAITTRYDANNQLSSVKNPILANAMTFVIETADGVE